MDLFLPSKNKRLSSTDRGQAFLWLIYHYLESSTGPNPFDDYYSAKHPGRIPNLRRLTLAQYESENVDTNEEIEWGNKMSNQRNVFLQKLVSSTEMEKKTKSGAPHFVTGTPFFFSHFDYLNLSIKRYQETAPEMIQRSFSQQSDLNKVERPFLYYIPSTQQSAPSKPQPKGNPRSILSRTWTERLMSIFSTPYLPANTLRSRSRTYNV